MASLYKRHRSPFWWIKFRDSITGLVHRESTGLKIGVGADTRKAKEIAARKTLEEATAGAGAKRDEWKFWVRDYLTNRYTGADLTLLRYLCVWRTLVIFFEQRSIDSPRQLQRHHCMDYMTWRMTPDKSIGKYRCSHNTALMELKSLGMIMSEAVRRGFAPFNPCRELGIKKIKVREKPEFTDADLEKIALCIQAEPEPARTFFYRSFEIARYQGCRLSETYLNPMTDVEITNHVNGRAGTISFRAKGRRTHVTMLHPKLIPLFDELKSLGSTETYPKIRSPSLRWFEFLKKIGMKQSKPGACFHSLRVTTATRMARAGITESKAMRYIGHASVTVHRGYQRLLTEDLSECAKAVG